jgi:hypothetical protein
MFFRERRFSSSRIADTWSLILEATSYYARVREWRFCNFHAGETRLLIREAASG